MIDSFCAILTVKSLLIARYLNHLQTQLFDVNLYVWGQTLTLSISTK